MNQQHHSYPPVRSLVPALLILLSQFTLFIGLSGKSGGSDDETRLLRQPTISKEHIAFTYASDIWIVDRKGGHARRLTSTPAIESNPHFSPDGKWLTFASNRKGVFNVYVLPIAGGTPTQVTWFPSPSVPVSWTPDGEEIIYRSRRETAPTRFNRLWKISKNGGPSTLIPSPWGFDGSYSEDGSLMVVDRMSRWDTEWRHYRGGQNTPLHVLNLDTLEETQIPCEKTTDIQPVWMDNGIIYFLSDREWSMNIFSYDPESGKVQPVTSFEDTDIKWLDGYGDTLVFERDGYLHTLKTGSKKSKQLHISAKGDFPWTEVAWEDLGSKLQSGSLSPTGKRAIFEARGEIFTVPVKKGDTRNITRSSGEADHAPLWSPEGDQVAWFSDANGAYELVLTDQYGSSERQHISIGESKMAWNPSWSPDGKYIAFVDDDVRIRIVEIEGGNIQTIDSGGRNIDRESTTLHWSPDSKWLAYSKTHTNNFRRIMVYSLDSGEITPVTNTMADSFSPEWDRNGKFLYFLASTDLGLASGWANTSVIGSRSNYGVYTIVLGSEETTPFAPESDEEPEDKEEETDDPEKEETGKPEENVDNAEETSEVTEVASPADSEEGSASAIDSKTEDEAADSDEEVEDENGETQKGEEDDAEDEEEKSVEVVFDFENIERRTLALPMKSDSAYTQILAGPKGSIFVAEIVDRESYQSGLKLHKFVLEDREAKVFVEGVTDLSISADGKQLLYQQSKSWKVVGTGGAKAGEAETLKPSARMKLNRLAEWNQIFEEAWRYQRDYFYDPDMHGRDWDVVYDRYAPLVPHIQHRADLNYILDQMNGELSVGHSFVWGGDHPKTGNSEVGLLGADLVIENGYWKIERIYTFESWNPKMQAPLDAPGLGVKEGDYLLEINGIALTAEDDPYRLLDGTAGKQTILRVNQTPELEDAKKVVVEPIGNDYSLRQRAWVEDNRRRVDQLSEGKLAYIWVPNTGNPGVISFNRYFFAQQDKLGAIIDERYNGGGLLDDYMVDLMTRSLRASITNEVPNARAFRLPAGILGPKVLLINELAGSGGDFFPWVFRHQKAGKLVGTTTWGGLVKSSMHYPFVDDGGMTAPDNAVFDPIEGEWIGENKGIAPDIEVLMDAKSVAEGSDPQLEKGVMLLLEEIERNPPVEIQVPPFSTPAKRP